MSIGDITKALAAALSLVSLDGQFAVLAAEIYAHLKSQSGMTDEQIREHRDVTLDANELKLLANLAAAGKTA